MSKRSSNSGDKRKAPAGPGSEAVSPTDGREKTGARADTKQSKLISMLRNTDGAVGMHVLARHL